MEPIFQAHPIPQNVTNFEFHLVGDMTLKQFAYLAAGVGFAFLIFTTLSTVQPIIAWPIIVISSLLGVAFAFLPIQERPLDHWVSAFFKAIFKPTSLKFSSKILNPADPLFSKRLNHYLRTYKFIQAKQHAILGNPNLLPSAISPSTPSQKVPAPQTAQKKQTFIDKFKAGQTSFVPLSTASAISNKQSLPTGQPSAISRATPPVPQPIQPVQKPHANPVPSVPASTAFATSTPGILRNPEVTTKLPDLNIPRSSFQVSAAPPKPVVPQPDEIPKSEDLKKTVELAKEAQITQQEIVKIENSLSQIKQQAAQPGVDPKSYVENFEDLLTQLQKLNEQASQTAKDLAEVSKTALKPQPPTTTIKAKSIPTLKLTSFPNVINGIVTDSQGNYIEGAIVVAHDKQGLPVRALKSNKLGQFVAATPLPNGEYAIVVEKDNLVFDKVSVELNNEVLPPILVAAKKVMAAA